VEARKLEIVLGEFDDAARAAFERVLRHDTSGGLASLDERLRGAVLFDVRDADATVLRFALRVDHHAHGSEGRIVIAAGELRGVDLTAQILPAIEKLFIDVRSVACLTARKGLAAKMVRQGYAIEGYLLRKRLEH